MTDQVSVSDSDAASAASSRGGSSHGSSQSAQHPLLDFMGVSCTGSDWFTNCFPCAIVPILDDDVADKVLSRENAMNAMYAKKHDTCTSGGDAPIPSLNGQTRAEHSFDSEQGICIVQLPQDMVHGQSMARERSHISLLDNASKSGDAVDLPNGSVVNIDSSKLDNSSNVDIPKPKMKKRTISMKRLFGGRKETKI